MTYGPQTLYATLRQDPSAMLILERHLPGISKEDDAFLQPYLSISALALRVRRFGDVPPDLQGLWADLAGLQPLPEVAPVPPVPPSRHYEADHVEEGSAPVDMPGDVECGGIAELVLHGPSRLNPFTDVEVTATFRSGDAAVRVGGFYDGDGTYRIRFLPPREGDWTFDTASNAKSLSGIGGSFRVSAPRAGNHGPVRVRAQHHFAYADGTPYHPFGTTAYAWTHQGAELQRETLATLSQSPFTKIRMCVLPKSFVHNWGEPATFPFERSGDGGWDFTRPGLAHFRNLERRVGQLLDLGIEADLILFHPYDRWGFSVMPRWADLLYVRYLVRRLSAYRNVWWSLANEYDFMDGKTLDDWEAIAAEVVAEDHAGHLTSIHNGSELYDFGRDWVTHCSIQRNNTAQTAANVDAWRAYGKPVVIDEIGYEGDLPWGWGNLTAREMTRRAWEGAVRGGYVNHGETYLGDAIWWSHGGALQGESPARFAFLARIVAEVPSGFMEPLESDFDFPCGGDTDHRLIYFGATQPSQRPVNLPPGAWDVDVIDTWGMTVTAVARSASGRMTVALPGRPDIAIRLRRVTA
jgi:hypothetical protein